MGDDGLRVEVGDGKFGGDSDLEAAAADVDFGGAGTESDDGGNFNELRAEAFSGLNTPTAADMGSGFGLLRDDAPGRDDRGVEMIAAGEFETTVKGGALGFGRGHATEVRDGDLTAMDGKPHADQRRGKSDDDEDENLREQTEEANHATSKVDAEGEADKLRVGNTGGERSKSNSKVNRPTSADCGRYGAPEARSNTPEARSTTAPHSPTEGGCGPPVHSWGSVSHWRFVRLIG